MSVPAETSRRPACEATRAARVAPDLISARKRGDAVEWLLEGTRLAQQHAEETMAPHRKFRTNALIFALTMVALPVAAVPKDPCTLLAPAEIQSLAPNAKIGNGVSTTISAELGSASCVYTWGTGGSVQSGKSSLHVIVSDASKLFPGMSPAMIKEGLLTEVRKPGANASQIAGVGDAAVFKSNDPIRAEATAYVKGRLLQVTFQTSDARVKKDQVIALLKAAAQRL